MARISKSEKVPQPMQETYDEIVALTDAFCAAHLDEEIAQLARQATATLCRKRLSPLSTGKVQSWACAILYALAQVNFLFDKDKTPSTNPTELCEAFGLSKSTGGNKSKVVRDLLSMSPMDPKWYRPSKMDDNILAWMISVNGLMIDARHAPREIQEVAFAKGIIPYIPEPRRR